MVVLWWPLILLMIHPMAILTLVGTLQVDIYLLQIISFFSCNYVSFSFQLLMTKYFVNWLLLTQAIIR